MSPAVLHDPTGTPGPAGTAEIAGATDMAETTEIAEMANATATFGMDRDPDKDDGAAGSDPAVIDADETPAAAGARRSWRTRVGRVLPPLIVYILVLGLWHLASTKLLEPSKRFLLPAPVDVFRIGLLEGRNRGELFTGLAGTAQVALIGLLVAMIVGVGAAILMHQAPWIEQSLYPYAVILQTIPILAVVPLIGFWFGFELRSRVFVCALIAVFPIITNTLFGLQQVSPGLHDLFTLHRAGRLKRLWRLELPAAVPAMVAGFRISAGLAVIGAIVADFFFRQGDPGIGRLIDVYRQRLATEQLLTAVFLSSLLGLAAFGVFGWIGRRVDRSRAPRQPR